MPRRRFSTDKDMISLDFATMYRCFILCLYEYSLTFQGHRLESWVDGDLFGGGKLHLFVGATIDAAAFSHDEGLFRRTTVKIKVRIRS